MKFSLPDGTLHKELSRGSIRREQTRRAVPAQDKDPVCPYTLEPSTKCKTRRDSLRHSLPLRCSFTLEPCAG